MTKIQIKIPILAHQEPLAHRIVKVSNGLEFDWKFYNNNIRFVSTTVCQKKLSPSYLFEVKRIEEWLRYSPSSESLRAELSDLKKEENKRWEYHVEIIFSADVPIEIDEENNDVIYYTGSTNVEITNRNRSKLRAHIEHDRLDDFYIEKVKKCVLAIIMTYVLAYPDIELFFARAAVLFNEKSYHKDDYITYTIHSEGYRNHRDIVTTTLSFNQTMDWIKRNTSLFENVQKSPVAFSALTYILNREIYESLLYSIIGLESIFSPNSKGISYALQKRIHHIFPTVPKEKIKELYQARSKFVHGELKVGNYQLVEETIDDYLEMRDTAILATAILLESIRMLIAQNATSIQFTESITHHFK